MRETNIRRSRRLQEKQELWDLEALELAIPIDHNEDQVHAEKAKEPIAEVDEPKGMTIKDMLQLGPHLQPKHIDDDQFHEAIRQGYESDPFFKLIKGDPSANRSFEVKDDLIWMKNSRGCSKGAPYMK